jgi:hypothetical protein
MARQNESQFIGRRNAKIYLTLKLAAMHHARLFWLRLKDTGEDLQTTQPDLPMQKELIYPASRRKALLLLVGCIAFFALGIFVLKKDPLVGWITAIFFGLGIPLSILMLFSKRVYLKLTADGFEMASLFNKQMIRWSDVDGFRLGQVRNVKMIAIVYEPDYKGQKMLRKVSASLAGMEGAIPNSYVVSPDALLPTLNEWHARFAKKIPPSPFAR